ncbi:hypothetical protein [Planktothrix mougeotii]|uniref:Uncharacterized protein n=1 Tax=Planktothrix mougeotii LEGE 06226 TaxID=1828728 RepID=A0ABR9U9Y5_9CYAN|nr:hypothetical protein [Planktothrix mougeotii]MBE9143259.1 hypothetical protein [Planktothrix mougeotii LEGE 06226]
MNKHEKVFQKILQAVVGGEVPKASDFKLWAVVSDPPVIEFDHDFSIANSDFLQKMISFEKIKESYPSLIDDNVKSLSINFSVLAMR